MSGKTWPQGRPSVYALYLVEIAIEDPWRLWTLKGLAENIHAQRAAREPEAEERSVTRIMDALNKRCLKYKPSFDNALPEEGDGRLPLGKGAGLRWAPAWYAWRWGLTCTESYWTDQEAYQRSWDIKRAYEAGKLKPPAPEKIRRRRSIKAARILTGFQVALAAAALLLAVSLPLHRAHQSTDTGLWSSALKEHQPARTASVYSIGGGNSIYGYLSDPGPAPSRLVGLDQDSPPP